MADPPGLHRLGVVEYPVHHLVDAGLGLERSSQHGRSATLGQYSAGRVQDTHILDLT
jgi:hypothetical protein